MKPKKQSQKKPKKEASILRKARKDLPCFALEKDVLKLRPDVQIEGLPPTARKVRLAEVKPGMDYGIVLSGGKLLAAPADEVKPDGSVVLGGFHVDLTGAILPGSIWDLKYKAECGFQTGLTLKTLPNGKRLWGYIYLMGKDGYSRAGVVPADGWQNTPEGHGSLNWNTAKSIGSKLRMQLMSRAEFAAFTEGATEGKATGSKPQLTERVPGLTSACGLEQAFGSLWVWSRDKDSDGWPYVLGGFWDLAGGAGPRLVGCVHPGVSSSTVGARFRCDHLELD